jgi:hypothetical protein
LAAGGLVRRERSHALATLAVGLYFAVDAALKRLLPWHSANPETTETG